MRRKNLAAIIMLVFIIGLFWSDAIYAGSDQESTEMQEQKYRITDQDTGYSLYLDDEVSIIDDKQALTDQMKDITKYCNVAVVTTSGHTYSSTEEYAVARYEEIFGKGSDGIIFVIDRYLYEIYLASEGKAQDVITNNNCDSICDNTYIYATATKNFDYDSCCRKTLQQVQKLFRGSSINQPMRYISVFFIAFGLSMIICVAYIFKTYKIQSAFGKKQFDSSRSRLKIHNPSVKFEREIRKCRPSVIELLGSDSDSKGDRFYGERDSHGGGYSNGAGHSGGGHHI